jgi:hypothetical protein
MMHIRVGEFRSPYTASVWKLRKKASGLRSLKPEYNAKLDFKEIGHQDMDWVSIVQGLSESGNGPSGYLKRMKFLVELSDYQLLNVMLNVGIRYFVAYPYSNCISYVALNVPYLV